MAYRWLRSAKAFVFTPMVLLLLALVACGSATPAEPVVVEKQVIKEVDKPYVVTRAAPTALPKTAQTGKVVVDKLIVVLATPTKQSALECQVSGSATVNHRPSVEYLLGVDHSTGEIVPHLAEEWTAADDLRSFQVKLRKGVKFHNGFGEFSADDVVHSFSYYTNDSCKASYSDYFRNDPGTDIEVISDHDIVMKTPVRPALLYDYWLSEYRVCPYPARPSGTKGVLRVRPSMNEERNLRLQSKDIARWAQRESNPIHRAPGHTNTSTLKRV